ncbi:MAG: pyridoxamine 5'-phosphate oxidase family protein [Sulfurospirillum sp.]|nr:pyridoxamine 5'-phosphate oxidase family protein [Sulfurospirillum sp.]
MDLYNLFENTMGTGVLATASKSGEVNCAIYARPHVKGDSVRFVTLERKNLENLRENPYAYYLFRTDGGGYNGVRLELLLQEIRDDLQEVISLRRRHTEMQEKEFVLEFKILKTHPLIGTTCNEDALL